MNRLRLAASLVVVSLPLISIAEPKAPAPNPPAIKGVDGSAGRFVDAEHRAKALELIAKAEQFLRSRQDSATGGWSVPAAPEAGKQAQPNIPAITGLVLKSLLMDPKADANTDPALEKAIAYILRFRQPDGGIYDKILPSYNTSLALSALAKANTPKAREAIAPAQNFLRSLQFTEQTDPAIAGGEAARPVGKDHIFYGGVGYGHSGRPDNSNLNMFLQAMEDSGVSPQDESVQRALTFLKRTQMDDRINDLPFAKGSRQGGFVYSTAENAQSVDGSVGQSQAGKMEETLSDGTRASKLRAYGSMTYAGFKSYLYAEIPKTDLRIVAAYDWIRRNFSINENPGLGTSGLYYYFVVFGRALSAWGDPAIKLLDEHNSPTGQERRWANDLVDKLAELQNADGSFKSLEKRWMEDNPELIAAYALIALRYAAQ